MYLFYNDVYFLLYKIDQQFLIQPKQFKFSKNVLKLF